MKPSSLRTVAIATFIFDAGIDTASCFACTPFRIRVSMSAIGSVIPTRTASYRFVPPISPSSLPTRLRHARDLSFKRVLAEADPAHGKHADVAVRPAAELAAVALLDRVLWRAVRLDDHRFLRHARSSPSYARTARRGARAIACPPRPSVRS